MNLITGLVNLYRREPAATQTAAAVVFAAGDMLYRVYVQHTGVLSWAVVAAGGVALYGLITRAMVTPTVKLTPAVRAVIAAPQLGTPGGSTIVSAVGGHGGSMAAGVSTDPAGGPVLPPGT